MSTLRYVCVPCERFCYKKNVSQFKIQMDEFSFLKNLMAYIKKL